MGWLHLDESAGLYILDGYHRFQASSDALDVLRGSYKREVENDDVPLALIVSEAEDINELFFRLRKSARCSNKGENIRSSVYNDTSALIEKKLAWKVCQTLPWLLPKFGPSFCFKYHCPFCEWTIYLFCGVPFTRTR